MQATKKRKLWDGRKFDHLFSRATGINNTVKRSAELEDTLALIPKVISKYGHEAKRIAGVLQGQTLKETCKNIWNFCYRYIQYTPDEVGTEQLRSPARSWQDRKSGVDCDCYSIFISSILSHITHNSKKGVGHSLRVTAYANGLESKPDYQHIYIIVPFEGGYLTIDPVVESFNYEVPFQRKIDIPMNLQVLNGLGYSGSNAPAVGSVDYEDLFSEDMEAHFSADPGSLERLSRAEIAALESGMSAENWQQKNRLEFIQRNGMSPEQWADDVRSGLDGSGDGLGLFRRKNRGPRVRKKKKKKKGGGFLNIINKINKFNPVTALLRTGILIGMKLNYMNIARRVRWGAVDYSLAKRQNPHSMNKDKWSKLKNRVLKGLLKTHIIAGGKREHLLGAIFYGKGNLGKKVKNRITAIPKDAKRPRKLAGLGGIDSLDLDSSIEDILGYEVIKDENLDHLMGLNGSSLGVAPAAAMAAASAALGAIAAILKAIGPVEDENAPAKPGSDLIDKIQQASTTANSAATAITQIREDFKDDGSGTSTEEKDTLLFDEGMNENVQTKNNTPTPDKPKGKFMEFVGKYKWWLAGGGALALTGIGLAIWKPWKKVPAKKKAKSPGLSGTKSRGIGKTRVQRSAFDGKSIPALPKGAVKLGRKTKKSSPAPKTKPSSRKPTVSGINIT